MVDDFLDFKKTTTTTTTQYFTENPHVFTNLCWRFLEAKVPNPPPVTGIPVSPAQSKASRDSLKGNTTV